MSILLREDREFKNLTKPASQRDMDILEKSIYQEGCLEPIVIWKNIIIDGYKRYNICREEGIEYATTEMIFPYRDEAIIWVCKKRLEDMPRFSDMFCYLVGKKYISTKAINNRIKKNDHGSLAVDGRVSVRIGQEWGLGRGTIERYGAYAAAMDKIAYMDQELFDLILSGKISLTRTNVINMVQSESKALKAVKSKYLRGRTESERTSESHNAPRKSSHTSAEEEVPLSVGIKEMPPFDPDMELNGLALTIPTWTAAIARAESKSDMTLVSKKEKENIRKSLKRLEQQIQQTLEALK